MMGGLAPLMQTRATVSVGFAFIARKALSALALYQLGGLSGLSLWRWRPRFEALVAAVSRDLKDFIFWRLSPCTFLFRVLFLS